jgi:hypothetical protein
MVTRVNAEALRALGLLRGPCLPLAGWPTMSMVPGDPRERRSVVDSDTEFEWLFREEFPAVMRSVFPDLP